MRPRQPLGRLGLALTRSREAESSGGSSFGLEKGSPWSATHCTPHPFRSKKRISAHFVRRTKPQTAAL